MSKCTCMFCDGSGKQKVEEKVEAVEDTPQKAGPETGHPVLGRALFVLFGGLFGTRSLSQPVG